MFFLSFQEWLVYHGLTLSNIKDTGKLEHYLSLYLQYCKAHHICPNLYDVYTEEHT